jgi:hypothetical protein
MELNPEQIKRFKEFHKDLAGFENFTEDQVREMANGTANYYLTLFKIHQRIIKQRTIPRAIPSAFVMISSSLSGMISGV